MRTSNLKRRLSNPKNKMKKKQSKLKEKRKKRPSNLKRRSSNPKKKMRKKLSILKQNLSILRQKLNNPSRKVAHHRTQWEKVNWPMFWPIWVSMANLPVQKTSTTNPRRKMHLKNHMQKRQKKEICLFMMKKR